MMREKDEWDEGHVPDAPSSRGTIELRSKKKFPTEHDHYLSLWRRRRSALAAEFAKWANKKVRSMAGGSKPGKRPDCQREGLNNSGYPPSANCEHGLPAHACSDALVAAARVTSSQPVWISSASARRLLAGVPENATGQNSS